MTGHRARGPSLRLIPEGEDRERLTCPDCGYIAYENPKIVVGSVVVATDGRIVLCRRAIEPARGLWTLPAGYMELGETPEEGAAREAMEEATARIALEGMLAVYTIRRINQVQIFYRARLTDPEIAIGPESLEVGLFAWDEIPWSRLAFPTVRWALADWRAGRGLGDRAPGRNPPESL